MGEPNMTQENQEPKNNVPQPSKSETESGVMQRPTNP